MLVVVARLVEHLSQADARASTVLIAALQLLVCPPHLAPPRRRPTLSTPSGLSAASSLKSRALTYT